MSLRRYAPGDAAALAGLHARSVRHYGPRAYSAEQVDAWAATASATRIAARATDGRLTIIAIDNGSGSMLGHADIETNGHVDFLYCAPEAAGRGVGDALYLALERHAIAAGIHMIRVEASELAVPLFRRNGFRLLHRNDLDLGGVTIHNFAMEKRLFAGRAAPLKTA